MPAGFSFTILAKFESGRGWTRYNILYTVAGRRRAGDAGLKMEHGSLGRAARAIAASGRGPLARAVRLLAAAAVSLVAAGCADTSVNSIDPLEPMNRFFFDINSRLDRHAAEPAASFYHSAIPGPVRLGIHNFISNLSEPVTFANDLLQGQFAWAGDTVARFGLNTTVGVCGLTDFASSQGYPDRPQDFGITMGTYGVPPGPYLVLPLLGPETVRDFAGRYIDSYFVPTRYFAYSGKADISLGLSGLSLLDQRSQNVSILRDIERSSVDYYATTRSIYLQRREARIHDGAPAVDNLPNY